MSMVGQQMKANRIVAGTKLTHPTGDPSLPPKADKALRLEVVKTALTALQTTVKEPTVFVPKVSFIYG